MKTGALAKATTAVARPLKILVPLIREELDAGEQAGEAHYRQVGEMLNEAKDQVAYGSWTGWLTKNFELSQRQARRYMRLARVEPEDLDPRTAPEGRSRSIQHTIGERPARLAWKTVHQATDRVNVTRLAEERQTRDNEIKLHREVALKLIDLGYRAMATRLHPDRGGSREAMGRLNLVRDELKSVATSRRFI